MSTDNFPMPFSAIGTTAVGNGWLRFPEEQRGGSAMSSRIRIPAGISYVQLTTRSDRRLTMNHIAGSSTVQLVTLESQDGGTYRTSAPIQIEAADDTTELNLTVGPHQQDGEPEDTATIMVVPVAAPRGSGGSSHS